ncbi:hypothetical protein C8Q77DRAFT_800523 [Trametes polyzona]|nr:hypothetical protein C8Q77DRAFT_800523 [Trametes polyzona]
MDALPRETLQHIFELACTDGGETGLSLCLVSKSLHAIARTTRFNSVTLAASPRRLQLFITHFGRERDPARGYTARVRHLHVTFPHIPRNHTEKVFVRARGHVARARSLSPPRRVVEGKPLPGAAAGGSAESQVAPTAPSSSTNPIASASPMAGSTAAPSVITQVEMSTPFNGYANDVPIDPTETAEYLEAAQTLFRIVMPDLVTLVLQCGFTSGGILRLPFINGPFPKLREATFVGVGDSHSWFMGGAETMHKPLFPALTHLSLLVPADRRMNLPFSFWPEHAPRVTHLNVSHASYVETLKQLAAAVGVPVRPEPDQLMDWFAGSGPATPLGSLPQEEHPLTPTYPSVRYLLVQPSPGPIGAICGRPWTKHRRRVRVLKRMVESCLDVGVKAATAEAPTELLYTSHYERARWSWLQRIDEDGDWAGFWGWIAGFKDDEGTRPLQAESTSLSPSVLLTPSVNP